jgi:hypothetical protein
MSPSEITALSAVAVALASLTVSVWTGLLTRRHNRLSVTPHVRVNFSHRPGEHVKVTLSNSGIGPAVIKGMRTWVDGQVVSSTEAAGLVDALPKAGLSGEFYAFTFFEGDALSPGEEKVLIEFGVDGEGAEAGQKLRAALARVGLMIEYESMYGDRHAVTKSLTGEPLKAA